MPFGISVIHCIKKSEKKLWNTHHVPNKCNFDSFIMPVNLWHYFYRMNTEFKI